MLLATARTIAAAAMAPTVPPPALLFCCCASNEIYRGTDSWLRIHFLAVLLA
eukprot:SAG31_NODE_13590_length_859_cov_0.889474_2_plen_51_part_01